MPALNSFNLAGAATGKASSFAGQTTHLRTILSGTAQCTIDGLPLKVEANHPFNDAHYRRGLVKL